MPSSRTCPTNQLTNANVPMNSVVSAASNIVAARTRNKFLSPWVPLVGLLAIDSVTGGLRSPFLLAVMGPFLVLPLTLRWRGLTFDAHRLTCLAFHSDDASTGRLLIQSPIFTA